MNGEGMTEEGRGEGRLDEMRQDRRRVGQETCQHCGRPVPPLINIFIFKVTVQLLGLVSAAAPKTRHVFCVWRKKARFRRYPSFQQHIF